MTLFPAVWLSCNTYYISQRPLEKCEESSDLLPVGQHQLQHCHALCQRTRRLSRCGASGEVWCSSSWKLVPITTLQPSQHTCLAYDWEMEACCGLRCLSSRRTARTSLSYFRTSLPNLGTTIMMAYDDRLPSWQCQSDDRLPSWQCHLKHWYIPRPRTKHLGGL